MKNILFLISFCCCFQILTAQIYTVPYTGTNAITTCGGTVYDHNTTSSYSNSATGSLTINPTTTGSFICLTFNSFSVETCCDRLYIYNGSSISDPLIGTYTSNPGTICASNLAGSLTLRFTSDGSGTGAGFDASISCATAVPLPDLIVQSQIVSNSSVLPGGTTNISYVLKNQGDSPSSSCNTGFYLSVNNTWEATDIFISSVSTPVINAGLTYSQTTSITIPLSTPLGNYYLLSYTDYNTAVNEEIEVNNVNSTPITVSSSILDLYIYNSSLSLSSISPGTTITCTDAVYNQGNTSSTPNMIGHFLSTDLTLDASDVSLTTSNILAITAGSYLNSSASITIPPSTVPGNYYILSLVDFQNTVVETNEQNNVFAKSLIITDIITNDLNLINATCSNVINIGSNTGISYITCNQGAQYLTPTIGFYLSNDSIFDLSDIYLAYTSFSISANWVVNNTYSLLIPTTILSGNYYIIPFVDYANSIVEINENNNVDAIPVTLVNPQIDLLIDTPILPIASIGVTGSFSTSCYIRNAGNATSPTSNIGYYLSTDAVFDLSDVYLNVLVGSTISSGSVLYKNVSLTIPVGTAVGNYYLLYFVDYSNQVNETNELNNIISLPITIVSPFIDLKITNTNNPISCVVGSAFNAVCKIHNEGSISTSISNIGYYLSQDTLFDASDVYLNLNNSGTIAANSLLTRTQSITIPVGTAAGNYYIIYFADYTNQVLESNESNNLNYFPISTVASTVDLVIINQNNPSIAGPGNVISVTYYLANNGTATSSSSNVGFYLSTDLVLDGSDIFLSSNSSGTVLSGASNFYTKSITIPSTISDGNYYILCFADYTNVITEVSEVNNISTLPIAIQTGGGTSYIVPATTVNSITTCSGEVYDNGGISGTYANYSNGTLTINPGTVGSYISLAFTTFSVESGYDYLRIYDGTSSSAPLLGTYSTSPINVNATNASGALTLVFTSDGSGAYSGFSASISCITSIPVPDLTIVSGNSISNSTIPQGGVVTSTCAVKNQGIGSASSSNMGYYLSNDTILDASDVFLLSVLGGVQNSGFQNTRTANLTIPSSTAIGNYYILLKVDYSNLLSESIEVNNVNWNAISVITSIVDLTINTPAISPTAVVAGASCTATNNIVNQGNVSSSTNYTGFYLSSDTIWNVSDTYLTSTGISSILANATLSQSATVSIPLSTISGNYYIIYYADYNNLNSESNEINNTTWTPITIIPNSIDLFVATTTLSNSIVATGSTTTVNNYNFNQGNQTATNAYLGYYLSTDSLLDVSDVYLSNYYVGSVSTTSSAYSSSNLTIPLTTTPGNYYVIYFLDYLNTIIETNESNNYKVLPIQIVNPAKNLIPVNCYSSLQTVVKGLTVNAYCSTYNQGNTISALGNTGYYLSTDSLWSVSDVVLNNTINSGTLNPNQYTQVIANLTIPIGTTSGNYYIIYYVDCTNLVAEVNELNNTSFSKIKIVDSSIDLISLSPFTTSYTCFSGANITMNSTSYNNGTISSTSCNLGYYLSTDTIFDGSDLYLLNSNMTNLLPNVNTPRNTNLLIPATTSTGYYYVLIKSDYTDIISESNENNNISYYKLHIIAPTKDLVIQNPFLSVATALSGTSTICNSSIFNQGNTQSATCNNGYYLSNDPVFDVTDILLNNIATGTITAGSSNNLNCSLLIPPLTASGNYYILVKADYLNIISETIETNNVASAPIIIIMPFPDLTISNLTVSPTTIIAGSPFSVVSDIKNIGTLQSLPNNVGYYLSTDNVWDVSDIYLDNSSVDTLAIGDSVNNIIALAIPTGTLPGNYFILVYADHLNVINENIETNNVATSSIIVSAPNIDFSINTPIISSSSIISGDEINVSCNIENLGLSSSPTSNIGFYLSSDSSWDATDIYLGSSSVGSLAPGAIQNISHTVTSPLNTLTGNYFILYFVDFTNLIIETDETNNISSLAISVTSILADLTISNITASSTIISADSPITLDFDINNIGNTISPSNNIGYFLSTDNLWDISDTYLDNTTTTTIAIGGNEMINKSITLPSSSASGTYYILIYADYMNFINEANETNNVSYQEITINALNSIEETKNNQVLISIYPNPANDYINIKVDNIDKSPIDKIEIRDLSGRIAYSKDFENFAFEELNTTIDMQNFSDGVYLVSIHSKNNRHTNKITIQH